MSDNNALAAKVADAVMDTIEHHGRINRDDLIAAAAGAIARHEIARGEVAALAKRRYVGLDIGAGDHSAGMALGANIEGSLYERVLRFIDTPAGERIPIVDKAAVCEKVDLRPGAVHGRIHGASFVEYVTAYEAAIEAGLFGKAKG